jgi:hypothetical protein
MRAGTERSERIRRCLENARRNARWRARQLAELRRAAVRTTDTAAWPAAFYVRGGFGVVYRSSNSTATPTA